MEEGAVSEAYLLRVRVRVRVGVWVWVGVRVRVRARLGDQTDGQESHGGLEREGPEGEAGDERHVEAWYVE